MNAPTPPVDTETTVREQLVRQLFAADRGKKPDEATVSAYLLALRRMETPRLARVVERLLDGFERGDAELYRVPQPGTLWRVAKELRKLPTGAPRPPLELHGAPAQRQDDWDTAANTLLLNYVTLGLVQKAIHGQAPSRDAGRYAPRERTAVLQTWKNAWARDMREDRELYDGRRDGKALWADYMARAEGEIDQLIAAERAAA